MRRSRTGLLPRPAYVRDARIFVIAVEGEHEEPWYFEGLSEHGLIDTRRVRLVILPAEEGLSAPEHVAARLTAFEQQHALIPSDPRWLVVDVDRHHNLQAVLNEADRQGWHLAVSNPCFEVWLQLHLREVPVGTDSAAAKAEWKQLKSRGWPFEATHLQLACARAQQLHPGEDWIPSPPPATAVHRLVGQLPRV
jgi:hypothetical protein